MKQYEGLKRLGPSRRTPFSYNEVISGAGGDGGKGSLVTSCQYVELTNYVKDSAGVTEPFYLRGWDKYPHRPFFKDVCLVDNAHRHASALCYQSRFDTQELVNEISSGDIATNYAAHWNLVRNGVVVSTVKDPWLNVVPPRVKCSLSVISNDTVVQSLRLRSYSGRPHSTAIFQLRLLSGSWG